MDSIERPQTLEAHDLVLRYPGAAEAAVRGISLSVARGEILGLLGPNGAGKTTTIAMLIGLLVPTKGSVTMAGVDILSSPLAFRRRVGLVPQELAVYPALSARENLRFFGRLYGLSGKALARRVDETLERVGLAARAAEPVATFSGGMKRRVNIAAGLLHAPEILFLDEPTAGVDPQSRDFILAGLASLASGGLSVVFSTHYMEEAERLCDRVAIIDGGLVVVQGTPAELVQTYGGEPVVEVRPPSLESVFLRLTGHALRD